MPRYSRTLSWSVILPVTELKAANEPHPVCCNDTSTMHHSTRRAKGNVRRGHMCHNTGCCPTHRDAHHVQGYLAWHWDPPAAHQGKPTACNLLRTPPCAPYLDSAHSQVPNAHSRLTMYRDTLRGTGVPQRPTRKPRAERCLRATLARDWGQKSNTCTAQQQLASGLSYSPTQH